ncbi:MAG: hypothetical protein SVW77_02845 [Candidatus Nanohaloarchaea archaeon]|nr:hypothetical protein [Candidatus Nanohaloarchaea archaeon]
MNLLDSVELLVGSTVLIAGLGFSAITAARESFPGVFVGFVLFLSGYKLSQVAVRDSEETPLRGLVSDMLDEAKVIDLFMAVVGTGAIAYGFLLLFQAFGRTDVGMAAVSSALMFAGYVIAHYGVNKTVV